MSALHYIFKDDKVYAVRAGKVVASADDIVALEEKVAFGDPGYGEDQAYFDSGGRFADPHSQPSQYEHDDPNSPYYDQPCPKCGARQGAFEGGHCMACGHQEAAGAGAGPDLDGGGGPLGDPGDNFPDYGRPQAAVVGPGGLKGKVLGKVRDLWGDEVAVRFENGRIAHLRVLQDGSLQGGFTESTEKVASTTTAAPGDDLRERLETAFDESRDGVTARLAEVESIRMEARGRIASASAADAAVFDSIMLTAEVERGTLREALDAIEADEASQADLAPYSVEAAPAQESLGRGDGNWLDGVVSAMIAEAEGQDLNKLANEEPALFVSDLNDGAVADTGVTRDMATTHIRSKTAGLAPELATDIERTFLANVETARKQALSDRKTTVHKEAAAREDQYSDLPDDILFS